MCLSSRAPDPPAAPPPPAPEPPRAPVYNEAMTADDRAKRGRRALRIDRTSGSTGMADASGLAIPPRM